MISQKNKKVKKCKVKKNKKTEMISQKNKKVKKIKVKKNKKTEMISQKNKKVKKYKRKSLNSSKKRFCFARGMNKNYFISSFRIFRSKQ